LRLGRAPRIEHLTDEERRLLRLAANRLGEKGEWNLDELKIEFQELIFKDAPIEISGFTQDEIDQILIGDEAEVIERGPLEPEGGAVAIARSATSLSSDPIESFAATPPTPPSSGSSCTAILRLRLVLTDEPYNVPIAGHVTGGDHREFAMASGEMTPEQFLAFNVAWIEAAAGYLCDGGMFGTFIDWRGLPTVNAATFRLDLEPLNL
jgi:hypothetical protein